MAIVCAGCERPIYDKFMLTIVDRTWHAKCVKCAECQASLSDNCYVRDGRIFCKPDFFKRYGTQCGACSHPLAPDEMVRRAADRVYHLKCFRCLVCRRQMTTGEEYFVLDPTRFMCKEDYLITSREDDDDDQGADNVSNGDSEHTRSLDSSHPPHRQRGRRKSSSSLHTSPQPTRNSRKRKSSTKSDGGSESEEDEEKRSRQRGDESDLRDDAESANGGGDKKIRVPRTCIKDKQLDVLSSCFSSTPKPSRQVREQLAAETGLTMRVIQVWFQNKRSKERKMQQMGTGACPGVGRGRLRGSPRRTSISSPPMSLHSEEASPGGTLPPRAPYFSYQENGHQGEFYRNHDYDEYPQEGENETNMAAHFLSNAPASAQLQPIPDNHDDSGNFLPPPQEMGTYNNRSPTAADTDTVADAVTEGVEDNFCGSPAAPLLEMPQAMPPPPQLPMNDKPGVSATSA